MRTNKKVSKRSISKKKVYKSRKAIQVQRGGKFTEDEFDRLCELYNTNLNDIIYRMSVQLKRNDKIYTTEKIYDIIPIKEDGHCTYTALSKPLGTTIKELRVLVSKNISELYLFKLLCYSINSAYDLVEGKIPLYEHNNKHIIIPYLQSHFTMKYKDKTLLEYLKFELDRLGQIAFADNNEDIPEFDYCVKHFGDDLKKAYDFMRFIITIDNPENYPIDILVSRNPYTIKTEKFIGVDNVLGVMMLDEQFEMQHITKHYNLCILYINKETISIASFGNPLNKETRFIILSTISAPNHTDLFCNELFTFDTLPDIITEPLLRIVI
jgi:hypothetical protein